MLEKPRPMRPCGITAWSATCAAGAGLDALARAIAEQRSGLRPNDWQPERPPGTDPAPLPCWIGRVPAVDTVALPPALSAWDCRATKLAWLGLQGDGFFDAVQGALRRHGAGRVGLVLGTSAATIGATESAYRRAAGASASATTLADNDGRLNTPHALAAFVQCALGTAGPCVTVSTACSSSAKAFAQAERWLRAGWADAVVVGGVDALCDSLLFGFHALGLVSPEPCRPFDARRSGVSVGEAAAFVLLERDAAALQLRGHGESNDAHHMSAPHPQGLGAELALSDALARADLDIECIDYLNLHGTASGKNDDAESDLVKRRFARRTHASGTKGLTGHTMGAAGALEAVICLLAIERGVLPGTANSRSLAPDTAPQIHLAPAWSAVRTAASHSFGFGGNNCVLVFEGA